MKNQVELQSVTSQKINKQINIYIQAIYFLNVFQLKQTLDQLINSQSRSGQIRIYYYIFSLSCKHTHTHTYTHTHIPPPPHQYYVYVLDEIKVHEPKFGTILNVIGVLVGGICGLLFGKRFSFKYQESLTYANGLCVLFLGVAGTLEKMMAVENEELRSDF